MKDIEADIFMAFVRNFFYQYPWEFMWKTTWKFMWKTNFLKEKEKEKYNKEKW